MAILEFRVSFEEEDASIYRDIQIKHTASFKDLHIAILQAYNFDQKHQATFYRSNDHWQKGREISLEKYDKDYKAPPLLMQDTKLVHEISVPKQKFIYLYDFTKEWVFYITLIAVYKEMNSQKQYPWISAIEGTAPSQYTQNNVLGEQFIDIEEKYDLSEATEGFAEETDIE